MNTSVNVQAHLKSPGGQPLRVACVVPTYNGRQDLARLLASLKRQSASFDLLIVDSSSTDGTYELAKTECRNVLRIPSREFNHGGTRQLMVDQYPDYDVYIYLTQDAYLEDECALQNMLEHFNNPEVGAVCGRQLPHHDANILSQHARLFNYPSDTQIKTIADAPRLGIKTAFMSNSFSGYRRQALTAVGGFPSHVILSEDMYVAAKMLMAGWNIVYSGSAACRHSHNYSIYEEFRRYFDVGVFQGREAWIGQRFGGAGGEGLRFVKSELGFVGYKRFYLYPLLILRTVAKLLGYKLGQKERYLPLQLKRKLSMYRGYWNGPYA